MARTMMTSCASCTGRVSPVTLCCVQYYRFPLLELFKLEARFVMRPGQHVNNMEENTNYLSLQCNSLAQILETNFEAFLIQTNEKKN